MPHLAILFASSELGGAERYVQTIATAAAERSWRVSVAFPARPATDPLRRELSGRGIQTLELGIGSPHGPGARAAAAMALREAARTVALLARLRATCALVMLAHPDNAAGAVLGTALLPVRSVVVVQLVPQELRITSLRRRLYAVARALGQVWVAVSADNAARLEQELGWAAGTVTRIPNGVAVQSPSGAPGRDQHPVRTALGLPPHAKVVLTVARLNAQKGLDVLARAIPEVAAAHPDAVWLWAGEGEDREALAALLAREGMTDRVRMLGARGDVPELLRAADLFVLPSRFEGLPFALLEAMAAGVPVVATDLPAVREIISDRRHGLLAAPEDPAALARAMDWMLAHETQARAMAAAALARIDDGFRAQDMVARTLALLARRPG